ncbi:hypothetical protein BH11PAT2_BH11PAT2_04700 [soil metagenome]
MSPKAIIFILLALFIVFLIYKKVTHVPGDISLHIRPIMVV